MEELMKWNPPHPLSSILFFAPATGIKSNTIPVLSLIELFFISETKRPCLKFSQLSIKDSFRDFFKPKIEVFLIMYTRNNLNCGQPLFEQNNSLNVNFRTNKKTIWLVHGYRPTGSTPQWLQKFRRILLIEDDMNVIVVDWNRGATTLLYSRAIKNARKVAASLSQCIQMLLVSLEFYVWYMLYNIQCVVWYHKVVIKECAFNAFPPIAFRITALTC